MKHTIVLALGIIFFACGSPKPNVIEKRAKEVMDIHDAAMAKMDKMQQLSRKIRGLKSDTISDSLTVVINSNLNNLQIANDAMMDWMHDYKIPSKDAEEQKALTYLDMEEQRITAVANQIDSAIAGAESFLK